MDDVIIVGAGPAGLMLATNLIRFGHKITILDDRPDKTATGRADGLQPKTIETLRQLGLASGLLEKGVKIWDICFWNSSPGSPLHRTGRKIHYPPSIVDVLDPYILLVHQGMVEEVFLRDLAAHGVNVRRSARFLGYSTDETGGVVSVKFRDLRSGREEVVKGSYLVGCDGAHSGVRKSMRGVDMRGESGGSAWGVLDGVIETAFPDLWSKVVISSETEGTVLCIPRERNMTRLYIELHPNTSATEAKGEQTQEYVMQRAKAILAPFEVEWKSVEWFGVYKVGQRVSTHFSDPTGMVFIAGDAAHTHSPKAAQGMNVSMHDTFNLAWKLSLTLRKLAPRSLLSTYTQERRKIAQDLINFDYEHANAFSANDPVALAENFAKNIRFISGVGAEYGANVLNSPGKESRGQFKPGALMGTARVERYIDANPVDLQLDIPMLGQFRLYFFTPNIHRASNFLQLVCRQLTSSHTVLGRASAMAQGSFAEKARPKTSASEFLQPDRYTAVSQICTFALVTTMAKAEFEIADLPKALRDSRWTVYVDNILDKNSMSCTDKYLGGQQENEVAIVNVRPDGYIGSSRRWSALNPQAGNDALNWLDQYYGGFLSSPEEPTRLQVAPKL